MSKKEDLSQILNDVLEDKKNDISLNINNKEYLLEKELKTKQDDINLFNKTFLKEIENISNEKE